MNARQLEILVDRLDGQRRREAMSDEAEFPAVLILHWPGQEVACCADHARKVEALGKVMGFQVTGTPCGPEVECQNCRNEASHER